MSNETSTTDFRPEHSRVVNDARKNVARELLPPQAKEYVELATHLSLHEGKVLSIEILPSSTPLPEGHASCLLVDVDAVAIRKRDLVKAFVYARQILMSAVTKENGFDRGSLGAAFNIEESNPKYAAWITLMLEPEHLSAANHRKRSLSTDHLTGANELRLELAFLQSLLTSPLHKHSKSPTLWYQRFWIMKHCRPWQPCSTKSTCNPKPLYEDSSRGDLQHVLGHWMSEFGIILDAAEQHGKNYPAFHYARKLWVLLWQQAEMSKDMEACCDAAGSQSIKRLTNWCVQHPRDISGLTFLHWLCRFPRAGQQMLHQATQARRAIEEFKGDLVWEGASINQFLRLSMFS